jgi:hypothetical protein
MDKPKTWRERARLIIDAQVGEWILRHGAPQDADQRKALLKFVNAAYCWGPREAHPYKSWCREMREFKVRQGWEPPNPSRRKSNSSPQDLHTGSLFE